MVVTLAGFVRTFEDFQEEKNNFYLFPTLIALPFLMSALRGDNPFDRTFIVICIPFSMFAGIALTETVNGMNNRLKFIFPTLIVVIASSSFYFSITSRDKLLLSKLESGMNLQDITNNYYQNYYRPSALMREFTEKYREESIFLKPAYWWKWDAVAMPKYLAYWSEIYGKTLKEVYEYSNVEIRDDWIQSKKPIYLVTNDANVLHLLKSRYPVLDCRRITSPGQFGMVIECNHRDQLKSDQLEEPSSDQTFPWVALGRGWYATEYAGSLAYRWGSADNTLWLVNPYDTPIHITLALTLASYETTRPVELWHDRRLIARWDVQRPVRTYRIGVTASPGQTRLRLRAPTTYDPQSQRELSVMALKVQLADDTATESK